MLTDAYTGDLGSQFDAYIKQKVNGVGGVGGVGQLEYPVVHSLLASTPRSCWCLAAPTTRSWSCMYVVAEDQEELTRNGR